VSSDCHVFLVYELSGPGSQVTVLVYDFVACKAPSAAGNAETTKTDRQTDRKVSNHKNEEYFRLCTPPTSLPFFTRPITANFSTSRQAVVAEPLACDSRNQDNADTSYPKRDTTPRDATRMYSISLASLCPTTKTRLEILRPTSHRYRSNTVSSQLTEPPPVRPSRGQTSPL
jgi:hypothetical protein